MPDCWPLLSEVVAVRRSLAKIDLDTDALRPGPVRGAARQRTAVRRIRRLAMLVESYPEFPTLVDGLRRAAAQLEDECSTETVMDAVRGLEEVLRQVVERGHR